jgi:hypothetical protein
MKQKTVTHAKASAILAAIGIECPKGETLNNIDRTIRLTGSVSLGNDTERNKMSETLSLEVFSLVAAMLGATRESVVKKAIAARIAIAAKDVPAELAERAKAIEETLRDEVASHGKVARAGVKSGKLVVELV